jgi:hypothetical protein
MQQGWNGPDDSLKGVKETAYFFPLVLDCI